VGAPAASCGLWGLEAEYPTARVNLEGVRGPAVLAMNLFALLGGCGHVDYAGPEAVTRSFYAAVADDMGRDACSALSRAAREALEEEQQRACPQAVLEAEVDDSNPQVRAVEVAATGAAVELRSGRFVFLDQASGRWEISAADCLPRADQKPFDCTIED
jgi:hypothetical protein